jgi:hypothetical protein
MHNGDDFPLDPRSLSLTERREFEQRLQAQQRHWLDRLRQLAELEPASDFPAFLLATSTFESLRQRIGVATSRQDLPTGTVDEIDHFVDAYRDYLRTDVDEDAFASRRAG